MRAKDIPSLLGVCKRYARGEGDLSEITQLVGIDDKAMANLFRESNILDARGRVTFGVSEQDVLNVILFSLTIAAGRRATVCQELVKKRIGWPEKGE
jgi:hypothetical protein